jgi:hypothetical protein
LTPPPLYQFKFNFFLFFSFVEHLDSGAIIWEICWT